jgi:hypothetical protein
MGRVAFSLNDWKENVGPGAISNPTRHDWDPLDDGGQVVMYQTGSGNRYYSHARWQFSANGMYQLPYGYSITEERFENLWNVDLRVAKNVSFGDDVRVTFTAELFNALNSNTMLRQTRDVLSDQFGRVDEILAPRIARFGARVSF